MDDNKVLPVAIISFLAGAFVGAVLALLYAPKSGEELRMQIRTEADERVRKIQTDVNKAVKEIEKSIEEGQTQLKGYIAQLQSKGEEEPTPKPEA